MNGFCIALAQTEIVWENRRENLIIAERLICQAKESGANYVFFPEMSFTGFSMNTKVTSEDDEYTIDYIKKLSLKYKTCVGFGWVKKERSSQNHYTIVNDEGKVISDYVKIHPFSFANEDKCFEAGNRISYFNIYDIPCTTFICYDLRFPEIFQIASKKSEIIFVPANWPAKRAEHWRTLLRARAIENQIYIVAINCCGDNIGGIDYYGDSCVINPEGDVLITSRKPGLLLWDSYVDVELFREKFPVKQDRREELYNKLVNSQV